MAFQIYNVPFKICSCRDEEGNPTMIARKYKIFYDRLQQGNKGVDILNEMGIKRMCCRQRFLSIPAEFMINRSKDRFFNHAPNNIISENTRELRPGVEPPDFPILPV